MAITFEKHKLAGECFSSPVRAHDQTTVAEYSLHWWSEYSATSIQNEYSLLELTKLSPAVAAIAEL